MVAMLVMAGIAQAANDKLSVQDISMEAGSSVILDVALENETTNLWASSATSFCRKAWH